MVSRPPCHPGAAERSPGSITADFSEQSGCHRVLPRTVVVLDPRLRGDDSGGRQAGKGFRMALQALLPLAGRRWRWGSESQNACFIAEARGGYSTPSPVWERVARGARRGEGMPSPQRTQAVVSGHAGTPPWSVLPSPGLTRASDPLSHGRGGKLRKASLPEAEASTPPMAAAGPSAPHARGPARRRAGARTCPADPVPWAAGRPRPG